MKKQLIAVASMFLLAACGGNECLKDSKETATVLEVENICSASRYNDCAYKSQRLRMQREDGTVCGVFSQSWIYKPGDKIRGPI